MSTVRIPPVLRAQAGGAKTIEVPGATVGEVLEALAATHPGLRDQLFTAEGDLNRFVNVYVDGQDVRYAGELTAAVGERDEVIVLPAMAGGAAGVETPGAGAASTGGFSAVGAASTGES